MEADTDCLLLSVEGVVHEAQLKITVSNLDKTKEHCVGESEG